MDPSSESSASPSPEGVWVEHRLDGLQVRLPTTERNLLVLCMRLFVTLGRGASLIASLFLGPWIFTAIEGGPIGALYGGVNMASLVLGTCFALTVLATGLLYTLVSKTITRLQEQLYPTELIISPHALLVHHTFQSPQKIPSVSLKGVRQTDGRSLEILLDDGTVVELGRGQRAEILSWLEAQLRAHITRLRTRQGEAHEVPRALQELRQ